MSDDAKNYLEDIRTRIEGWVKVCKEGTLECVDILLDMWDKTLGTFSSLFTPSRKADGLYGEL